MTHITTDVDPRTIESIKAQGPHSYEPNVYRCGCHQRPPGSNRYYLCDYHEGFDDALGLVDVAVEELQGGWQKTAEAILSGDPEKIRARLDEIT